MKTKRRPRNRAVLQREGSCASTQPRAGTCKPLAKGGNDRAGAKFYLIYIYIYIYIENITHNAEYILVDSLSFKLPGHGQSVTDRRSVSFQTDGGNIFNPQHGSRVLKFRLNGEGWLDPITVRVMFDVLNTSADPTKTLKAIRHCHGFFKRLRLSLRGQIIEDISEFGRISHMFNIYLKALKHVSMICVRVLAVMMI